jgi:hypothetical protein
VLDILYRNDTSRCTKISLLLNSIWRDTYQYNTQKYNKNEHGVHEKDSRDAPRFKDGRMDGWMDGWTDRQTDTDTHTPPPSLSLKITAIS